MPLISNIPYGKRAFGELFGSKSLSGPAEAGSACRSSRFAEVRRANAIPICMQLPSIYFQPHQEQCSSKAGNASPKRLRISLALRQCSTSDHGAQWAPHGRTCCQRLGGGKGRGHHCAGLNKEWWSLWGLNLDFRALPESQPGDKPSPGF